MNHAIAAMNKITPVFVFGFLFIVTAPACHAQEGGAAKFTLFAGPGITNSAGNYKSAFQGGMSFDLAFPGKWFGYLLEGGYIAPGANLKSGRAVFSANYIHAWPIARKGKIMSFATAGYSRLFGAGNAINYGVGVDYQVSSHHSVRLEVRDYYAFTNPQQHNVGLRIGWVIYIED